jgi:hypothetical protein
MIDCQCGDITKLRIKTTLAKNQESDTPKMSNEEHIMMMHGVLPLNVLKNQDNNSDSQKEKMVIILDIYGQEKKV